MNDVANPVSTLPSRSTPTAPGSAPVDPANLTGGVNPSAPFIRRPVATALLMIAIMLTGIVGFRLLPLSALPEVDYPTVLVSTGYPGASPEVMSATVTGPLERQFGQMAGLKRMSSVSSGGASSITLQFGLTGSLDVAEQEVQAAVNAAASLLPADLPAPPIYAKVNPADAPVLTLGVTSDSRPLTEVQNLVDERVAQKLAQVAGVGLVSLSGGQRPAVRIQVNTVQLASFGLSMEQLRTTIANANANAAKGSFDGPTRAYAINANDQLATAQQYGDLVVAYRNNAAVHLSDVATIADGAENNRLSAWMNRTPAIIVDIQRQPGANVIGTVDQVKARLPELQAQLPADIHVTLLADRTTGIRASVADVEFELVLAVGLVVLVIFLFLGSIEATLIAGVSVPLSIIGTCGVMYLLGYSLNNLTLMAMTVATGFVVDDAIVVIENISRFREAGRPAFAAALEGARQIGFTIISLTVSLIAVLIPLLFIGDVVGRLFREFAVTLAVTIVISAIVALTLVPMLSARLLKTESAASEHSFSARSKRAFQRLLDGYDAALGWVLARQGLTLMVALVTLVLTVAMYVVIPKGLFPVQDTGQLQGVLRTDPGASFARVGEVQQQVADALLRDPDVDSLSSFIGVDRQNATLNSGRLSINLKPKSTRSADQATIMARLIDRACAVAGATLYLQPVQDLTIESETGPTQFRLSLGGSDPAAVARWSHVIANHLHKLPQLRNVVADGDATGPALNIAIDRSAAARVGVTASAVDEALYDAFGQRIISTIFTQSNQYRVILEATPGLMTSGDTLSRFYVPSGSGAPVPLGTFATITQTEAPLAVDRVAQFPAATVGFDLAPGVALGTGVDAINADVAKAGLPPTISVTFLGAADAFRSALGNQLWLVLAAVVCVYIVLGVLYESWVHPVTILSTLPSAGFGALLGLWITGNDLGVIGIIGLVLLIGIVKKNAIMMIDFALDAERNHGMAPEAAIRQAAVLRFRPILMTTLAAIFGALPLMLGHGNGSELRQPLGIAIVAGLIVSQLLTLFTTPVIYLAFDRLGERFGSRQQAVPVPAE